MIHLSDVETAWARVRPLVRRTPVLELGPDELGADVLLKLEFLQHTGSFKARGAFSRVLSAQERGELDPEVGLVVASGGNAGLANAYAAARLGVPAVGGGGLMAGVAAALEDQPINVVGVEPQTAPTLHAALDAGEPVDVPVSGVAADSLGARRIGEIAWDVARRGKVRSILVDDAAIVAARQQLWDRWRIVVEHGAAAALAALTTGAYVPEPDERVAVVLCGANTDPADL